MPNVRSPSLASRVGLVGALHAETGRRAFLLPPDRLVSNTTPREQLFVYLPQFPSMYEELPLPADPPCFSDRKLRVPPEGMKPLLTRVYTRKHLCGLDEGTLLHSHDSSHLVSVTYWSRDKVSRCTFEVDHSHCFFNLLIFFFLINKHGSSH